MVRMVPKQFRRAFKLSWVGREFKAFESHRIHASQWQKTHRCPVIAKTTTSLL
jgi:hypothetical protein